MFRGRRLPVQACVSEEAQQNHFLAKRKLVLLRLFAFVTYD